MDELYTRMGGELRALFRDLFDPKKVAVVRRKMKSILSLASQVGGALQRDAELLNSDVMKYLDHPGDAKIAQVMKKHAMRLEQETREL